MDNSFNGLRYSPTLGCLIGESGEQIRMRPSSIRMFLLLKQNLNKLVSKEQLLNCADSKTARSQNAFNESICEIRQVLGEAHLKTVPRVGYLLTPDSTSDETEEPLGHGTRGLAPGLTVWGYPMPTLVTDMVFNAQWLITAYQKSPRVWFGSLVLLAAVLVISSNSTLDTTIHTANGQSIQGHSEANCANELANCITCVPNFWQSSSIFGWNGWSLLTDCRPSG